MRENAEDLVRLIESVHKKCEAWDRHINARKKEYIIAARIT